MIDPFEGVNYTPAPIPSDYGERGGEMIVSVYLDPECNQLFTRVTVVPGADTVRLAGPCTLRFNER